VLVIDDDEHVRLSARFMLERLDYNVVEAVDGHLGLEMFKEVLPDLAAVILDMTMPRLTGAEVLKGMHAVDASVPVLLSTGYNQQEAARRFEGTELAGYLKKPYTLQTLSDVLVGVIRR